MNELLLKTYEVAVANHPVLLKETLICAKLLTKNNDWKTLTEQVIEENLLEARSVSTSQTYMRAIRLRLEHVPETLLAMMAGRHQKTARLALFYVLLNKNRLLREMMEEPVRDAMLSNAKQVPRDDIENFFESKRQNDSVLKGWSDTTWRKYWQNTLKMATETGVLEAGDNYVLVQEAVPKKLATFLEEQDETVMLHVMLDPNY